MTVRGLIAIVFNDDKQDMSKLCHLDRRQFLETAADQKEQPAVDGVVAAAFSPLDAMVASTGG